MNEQPRVFGWCQSHGTPDQFHHLCRGRITSTTTGVTYVCSCPNHEPEEN